MKQLDLAFQTYASTYNNAFPPSSQKFPTAADSDTSVVAGYSFLYKLLPYLEETAVYQGIPLTVPKGDIDATAATQPELKANLDRSISGFICPSNVNKTFQNVSTNPPQFAVTNYKAIGATTKNSLLMAADSSATPPYGTAKMHLHPDGAIYPAANNLPMKGIKDGTSHTIILMETIDDTNSRWMVGAECTMVGLPQASSPTGEKPNYTPTQPKSDPYFAPPSYDGTFGDDSAVVKAGLRTFLAYDFSPTGADKGKYEDPGWAKGPPAYGPSSAHAAIINVGMADGSVQSLSKQVDAANLFLHITKDNDDPFNLP